MNELEDHSTDNTCPICKCKNLTDQVDSAAIFGMVLRDITPPEFLMSRICVYHSSLVDLFYQIMDQLAERDLGEQKMYSTTTRMKNSIVDVEIPEEINTQFLFPKNKDPKDNN